MSKKYYNLSISVIRVVSMLSIVLGHICSWGGVYTYQLGNLGVDIFLLISGYLYGNKVISNKRRFIVGRVTRVMLPFWIMTFVLTIYLIFQGQFKMALSQFIEAALNLQGISWIFTNFIGHRFHVVGLSHCWFLTVIMICYILVLIIKNTKFERGVDSHILVALFVTVIMHTLLTTVGFNLRYIISYFIGYFYARAEKNIKSSKLYSNLSASMILICALRLVSHKYIDGTWVYDDVICAWSFIVLGSWCCLTTDKICQKFHTTTEKIGNTSTWQMVDKLSYPIYLTHYMFLQEPFNVKYLIDVLALQIIAFFILTIGSALALMHVTEFAIKVYIALKIKKNINNI